MASNTTPTPLQRYTGTAMALHWLLALMLVGSFSLGVYMTDLPFSPSRLKYYNWHKWAGVTILLLSFARLAWRITHRPPADLAMPAWQARAAHATHVLLYALFFAVPLLGWAYSSAQASRWCGSACCRCPTSCRWTSCWPRPSSPGTNAARC